MGHLGAGVAKTKNPKGAYTFYPIYDWSYRDVWKAIHDNNWDYANIYDLFYNQGLPVRRMRVSSFTHTQAASKMDMLHELEPETWAAIQRRVQGANAVGHVALGRNLPQELPPMFKDWKDHRDYLLENLIKDDEAKAKFKKLFARPMCR